MKTIISGMKIKILRNVIVHLLIITVGLFCSLNSSFAQEADPDFSKQEIEDELKKLEQYIRKYVVRIDASRGELSPGNRDTAKTGIKSPPYKIASGLIVDVSGIVITRSSVIQDMSKISIALYNGESQDATLIGINDQYGYTVLLTDPFPFESPHFVGSNSVRIGNYVFVVHNLGFSPDNWISKVKNVFNNGIIEIATNVWPGSVGAPVFNLNGQVVGILVSKLGSDQEPQFEELALEDEGIVIPMWHVLPGIKRIIDTETIGSAWMGITLTTLPTGIIKVWHISANGPARAAGIKFGDQVLAYNGTPIRDLTRIERSIPTMSIKQSVEFMIKRADTTFTIVVQLGSKPISRKKELNITQNFERKVEPGLEKYPKSEVNRILLHKRLIQLEGRIQSLKKILLREAPK